MIPKPKRLIKLLPVITIFTVLSFYYACKKDNKTTSTTLISTTVQQAKEWYETAYPVNTNLQKSIAAQAVKKSNNSWLDFSQFILPDWLHAVTYTRLGEKVIEMPIDSATFYGFNFENATANKIYSNKKYNSASFILINDGKSYKAYIMMIMADSAYVNNDLTKLLHNSYRTHDADFTGMVLYFTPKGQYVSGYAYQKGKILIPASSGSNSTSSYTNQIKTDQFAPKPSQECTDWYLNTYVGSELYSSEYVGTTCTGTDDGSNPSGGGNDGGGSDTPPLCQAYSNGSGVESENKQVVNVESPNPVGGGGGGSGSNPTNPTNPTNPSDPGDGGFPPPNSSQECTISVQDTVLKSNNLTKLQMDSLENILNNVNINCLGQALNNYFVNASVSFPVTLNPSYANPAGYDPSANAIVIQSLSGLTPNALEEELFHAYQNKTMPGGTAQYIGKPGSANIEFESKVMRDIQTYMNIINNNQGGNVQVALADPNYTNWLSEITNNYTQYPTNLTPTELAQYFNFIPEFLNQNPGYSNDMVDPNLAPSALFTLVQNSNCSN